MKSKITQWASLFALCLVSFTAHSQGTVNFPTAGSSVNTIAPPGTCFYNFYDSGGPAGTYTNNMNPALIPSATNFVTFSPSDAACYKVRATFTQFATETSFDALYVYDGTGPGTTLIASPNPIGFTPLAGGWWAGGAPQNVAANTVQAIGATGALTFQFTSDASVTCAGWTAIVSQVPNNPITLGGVPAIINGSANPITCAANVTVSSLTANYTSAANCPMTVQLQYSVNGGTFQNSGAPITITGTPAVNPLPSTTFTGLPVGSGVITWRIIDACNAAMAALVPPVVIASGTSQLVVADTAAPNILNCPSDATVNLLPGECSVVYTYPCITATDCGVWATSTGNVSNQTLPWTQTGQRQNLWDVRNLSLTTPMQVKTITVMMWNNSAAGQNVSVSAYVSNGATSVGVIANPAAWTLNTAPQVFAMPGAPVFPGTPMPYTITLTTPVTIAPGASKGFSVFASLQYGGGPIAALNGGAAFNDGTAGILNGALQNGAGPFTGGGFLGFQFYGAVGYALLTNMVNHCDHPNIVIASGTTLPSGSALHVDDSPFTFTYTVADPNNPALIATCEWTVVVNEYAPALTSMICNDLVEISLDETCTYSIGADDILEGGPYGCYDHYLVQIDKVAPFGNGPWVPANLNFNDIGKTYGVRVTNDPHAGNNNTCWGLIKIEDKLPPVLDCPGVTLPCSAPSDPGTPFTAQPSFTNNTFQIQAAGLSTANIAVSGVPAGASDLNVVFNTNHTWVGDINATLTAPNGTIINLFDRPGIPVPGGFGCAGDGMAVTFDDQAAATAANLENTCNAGIPTISGQFKAIGTLNVPAALANANGNWVLTVNDFVGGDGGTVNSITLVFTAQSEIPFPNGLELNSTVFSIGNRTYRVPRGNGTPVMESCSDVTLSYIDAIVPGSCATGIDRTINRKWTAVDASGNTSTCIQVIVFELGTLADIVLPPNYDGIDAPFFECGPNTPNAAGLTPDWIESQGLQGYPYLFGEPFGCKIGWTWDDAVIDVCDGTYKIRRKWTIVDWCTGEDIEHNQLIKVVDEEGPVWSCTETQFELSIRADGSDAGTAPDTFKVFQALPPMEGAITIRVQNGVDGAPVNTLNLTVSTDVFTCCASAGLPAFIVEDACSRINNVSAMVISSNCDGDVLAMNQYDGSVTSFPGNNFWDLDTLGSFGFTDCLPIGKHQVIYMAEDDCGNTSTCDFTLTVLDLVPPQMVCTEYTVVTVGYNDPNDCYLPLENNVEDAKCNFYGVSWIKATTFDQGSFDNCGNLYFTVRRMPQDTTFQGNFGTVSFGSFIDGLNDLRGRPNCYDPFRVDFPITEYQRATGLTSKFIQRDCANGQNQPGCYLPPVYPFPQGLPQNHPYPSVDGAGNPLGYRVLDAVTYDGCTEYPNYPLVGQDSLKVYCGEVGTNQIVVVRAYQLDDQGRLQLNKNGEPIYDECMVEIEVQDKIKPVCVAPANVTVSCEAFDPSLWAYGFPTAYDNCCLDSTKVITAGGFTYKGLTESRNLANFDTLCNRGTITRTFRVFDCHGLSNVCTQRVVVTYNQFYNIEFPGDKVVFQCDGTTTFGEPRIDKKDCELMAISYTDEIYNVVPDACFKIERTWKIINWCTYNPNDPCVYVPNPNPNALPNHPTNLASVIVSAPGTPAPWTATIRAIVPGATPTDYSSFWDKDANCYEYKQIIKVIDNEDPIITDMLDDCDFTANDPNFWNSMSWWDPIHDSHDLCEAPVNIMVTGIDSCVGKNLTAYALIFLDLDGDGYMETVLNTNTFPTLPPGFINYNNAANPSYTGGTSLQFDFRPVQPSLRYRFALRIQDLANGSRKFSVMWTDRTNPNPNNNNDWTLAQIPLGKHKIKWVVSDMCGNETTTDRQWDLHDCKPPTVVCLNGLSANIMPTGMITIWGIDFLQYGDDNCTPADQLVYSIRKSGTGTGFPVDANGNPIPGVTFTCSELGTQFVELWAKDKRGNAAYCETYIQVQDPFDNCNPNVKATVAGDLKTEAANGLEEANVEINGTHPALPPVNALDLTDDKGHFDFGKVVPMASNYTLTPVKDDNPLNGVTTYDLLLMSRHILGVTPLTSPYQQIAADVNKSGSITTNDIVELRKLILGIYTELPNNTSWRFVDKSFSFPNQNNPFQTQFPETKTAQSVSDNMMTENFVSVKVGDLNGNAVANSAMSADDRTAGTLLFDVEDRMVKAGETFTVNFKAAEKAQGYQFTMNHNNLEVVAIEAATANMTEGNFAVFSAEKALTTSFDGGAQAEFAVKFRATADGKLSQMLGVSSRITKSESYSTEGARQEVAFRFNGNGSSTIAGVGFELYQNQPNPFINKTVIGFHLPAAAEAVLTIFDETGRTLFTQKGEFAKGDNAITIDRAVLNTTGVMYYRIESAENTASKKMIQTK